MGSFSYFSNNKNTQEKENIKNTKSIILPNPNFRIKQTIVKSNQNCKNICFKLLSCYEIYKLTNIKSSFFIAYRNKENITQISKYDFKETTNITTINIAPMQIKYFFDDINNKEYLFIQKINEIHVFSILNENSYEKIYVYKEEGIQSRGAAGCFCGLLPIYDFLLFNDKYNKINYLVISFFYRVDCSSMSKKINILKFEKERFIIVKKINTYDSEIFAKKLFLIWEDNITNLNYLLYNQYNELVLTRIDGNEIGDKINLEGFSFGDYLGCIISNKDNKSYLYLIDNKSGLLIIIDLNLKKKVKDLKIDDDIGSIINWNNNYIIFSSKKYIYTFDTNIDRIINKTSINLGENIVSINKFIFEENNFYSLIVDISNEIISIKY